MIRLLAILLMLPTSALACACCAERGTRATQLQNIEAFETEEFARLQAGSDAMLYLTACGFDCVKGLEDPKDSYGVEIEFGPAQVVFDMSEHGALVFEMPGSFVRSEVDTDPIGDAADVQLYTELRLVGVVTGTDSFADVGPNQAALVLSGYGNLCLSAETLAHWSLQVSTEDVEFQLFGALRTE